MTAEVTKERTPSLLEIEQSLQMLFQDREETQDPEELAAIDAAIQEYVAKELGKVDRIRGYIRYAEHKVLAAKQAASEATSYAQIWQNRIDRVKAAALTAAQILGKKTFEGTAGSLSVRGNGGLQPLIITDPEALPDECCRMEGWIGAEAWHDLCMGRAIPDSRYSLKRVPDNAVIRAKLAEDCPACGGFAFPGKVECASCGGAGKNAIPGAYLADRGVSLIVR